MEIQKDRMAGCLIGGAAGDALGYPVEFFSEAEIRSVYGPEGITQYALEKGVALISDDTQMTLFTADGLLRAAEEGGSPRERIRESYLDWLRTQRERFPPHPPLRSPRMMLPSLFSLRAPGSTCLSALQQGGNGSPEHPLNRSKGCGGVMRVAPIGLFPWGEAGDRLGAEAAALTHGHPLGYLPAAMQVHMIRLVVWEGASLKDAARDARAALGALFPGEPCLPEFLELIDRAMALAALNLTDREAIHSLGEGWVGDEALAIALYCALKYPQDFDRGLIAAVNHRGDSDSTGAIAGNLLGASLGLSRIPEKYTENLELRKAILALAQKIWAAAQEG